jgi:hypothetical protein
LLVLCTARPELLDRRPGWGGGKRNSVTISLSMLEPDDTARLISELLDRSVLPAEVQSALLARAGGSPLFAEQFVRMFVERGSESAVPETVQGIIAARLDSLAPGVIQHRSCRRARAVAPHLGAARVCPSHARSSVAGETEWEFGHVLVREVAYGQIPRADRAAKHRAAAKWIESLSPDRSDDRAEMLAHHYRAALDYAKAAGLEVGDIPEAARLALARREAAERAASLGSHRQALRFYDAALELWPDDDPERLVVALRGRRHSSTPASPRTSIAFPSSPNSLRKRRGRSLPRRPRSSARRRPGRPGARRSPTSVPLVRPSSCRTFRPRRPRRWRSSTAGA